MLRLIKMAIRLRQFRPISTKPAQAVKVLEEDKVDLDYDDAEDADEEINDELSSAYDFPLNNIADVKISESPITPKHYLDIIRKCGKSLKGFNCYAMAQRLYDALENNIEDYKIIRHRDYIKVFEMLFHLYISDNEYIENTDTFIVMFQLYISKYMRDAKIVTKPFLEKFENDTAKFLPRYVDDSLIDVLVCFEKMGYVPKRIFEMLEKTDPGFTTFTSTSIMEFAYILLKFHLLTDSCFDRIASRLTTLITQLDFSVIMSALSWLYEIKKYGLLGQQTDIELQNIKFLSLQKLLIEALKGIFYIN